MGERTHRDPFYPGLRPRPERLEGHPPARLKARPAGNLGDRGAQLLVIHVVEKQPLSAGREGLVDLLAVMDLHLECARQLRCGLAGTKIACATPPAAAMWFSLIRIASYSPARWLLAPPAATAAFSRARSPGVVLRVSSTVAAVPCTARAASAAIVATPDRCARKFRAVRSAGEQGTRSSLDAQHRAAPLAPLSLRHQALEARVGIQRREHASAALRP